MALSDNLFFKVHPQSHIKWLWTFTTSVFSKIAEAFKLWDMQEKDLPAYQSANPMLKTSDRFKGAPISMCTTYTHTLQHTSNINT